MNSGIKRRLKKLESRLDVMHTEAREKRTKLAEIERMGNGDSLAALLLKMELEHGRKYTLVDIAAMAVQKDDG